MALVNTDNQQQEPELPTIKNTVIADEGGYWAGLSAGEFKSIYQGLRELSTLSSANYMVELAPYQPDSKIAIIDWFDNFSWLPWLATSCSLPLMEAQVDNVQAGHYQHNYITGNSVSDIQLTFLETRDGHILNTAQQIKDLMFSEDGTQGLPYDYMMWMTISLYERGNRKSKPYVERILVALQTASLDLAATNPNPIEVPLGFTRMYPMLK